MEPVIQNHMAPRPPCRKWTRQDYYRAAEAGIFKPEERLELINGEVITKLSPQSSQHAYGIQTLMNLFNGIITEKDHIRIQLPMAINEENEPEPDIAVVAGSARDYVREHPSTALLVAEVSDSTIASDRKVKGGLYASAGIPEYWILNLNDRLLEIYGNPVADPNEPFGHRYETVQMLTENDTLTWRSSLPVPVKELLPD
jgi:Uma2 family endonuclease